MGVFLPFLLAINQNTIIIESGGHKTSEGSIDEILKVQTLFATWRRKKNWWLIYYTHLLLKNEIESKPSTSFLGVALRRHWVPFYCHPLSCLNEFA